MRKQQALSLRDMYTACTKMELKEMAVCEKSLGLEWIQLECRVDESWGARGAEKEG